MMKEKRKHDAQRSDRNNLAIGSVVVAIGLVGFLALCVQSGTQIAACFLFPGGIVTIPILLMTVLFLFGGRGRSKADESTDQ